MNTMKRKLFYRKALSCLFVLLGMFLLSFLLLGLLSMIAWKMDGNAGLVSGGIIVIYVLVNVFGGFMMGKIFGKQKFFWGLAAGGVFFSILLLSGIFLSGNGWQGNGKIFPGLMICLVSGMIGGILSPGVASKGQR